MRYKIIENSTLQLIFNQQTMIQSHKQSTPYIFNHIMDSKIKYMSSTETCHQHIVLVQYHISNISNNYINNKTEINAC